ncbi:TPA: hypothetical protein ACP31J_002773 [Pseudomonas aeruginosa]|uniref:hypothetical protein n=1 Tax=Pseudomonas aeruginosa TaxID=287 RepID=UPI000F538F01|nr:hypothetical protein [Pseudomonas aeruginosa]MDU0770287.1 hypothetical protein [Pseudomonas aeruginosa]
MAVMDDFNEFMQAKSVAMALREKANSPATGLVDAERYLLYEAIFLRLYRAYENLLENVFLAYISGETTGSGVAVTTFVSPANKEHARAIITSSQPFLDWTSPSVVMKRAETYIDTGEPVRSAVAASQNHLLQAKKIRNHIAHNSSESEKEFMKVVQAILLTLPLSAISAGELLANTPTAGPCARKEVLTYFLERLESTALGLIA